MRNFACVAENRELLCVFFVNRFTLVMLVFS